MKKRILAILLVVSMVFSLTSCNAYSNLFKQIAGMLAAGSNSQSHSAITSSNAFSNPSSSDSNGIYLNEEELLAYFCEIAMSSEYGTEGEGYIRRWEEPVNVEVSGSFTQEDYDWLIAHIEYMNAIDGVPEITVVMSGGNFHVYFVPLAEMSTVISSYVEGNWGYFTYSFNDALQINSCDMAIATDVTTQEQRNHLIMEEFTQGFGLANDSLAYADSIYQSDWTEIQSLSVIDKALIEMLYSPVVSAGMPQSEAVQNLADWIDLG
jgi:hypothetical protein